MTLRRTLALTAAVLVAGCSSALTPFPTAPIPLPTGAKEPDPRVAICYNTLKTPAERVREMAQAQCPPNTVATPTDTDYRLDNCPLLTPGRATFACRRK